MNKKRRVILRTETYERISLRQTSKTINRQTFTLGIYKIEIRQVNAEKEQIVFETEIIGLIETEETNEEIRFVFRKN
jgi:hypothetical protein